MIGTGLCYHICVPPIHYKKQLDEARDSLSATRLVRDEWIAACGKARDERDALRLAIEAHNALCERREHAGNAANFWPPLAYLIPLPPAADAPERKPGWYNRATGEPTLPDPYDEREPVAAPEAWPNYGPQPPGYRAGGQLQGADFCKCNRPEHSPYSADHCYYCGRAILQQSPAQPEGGK